MYVYAGKGVLMCVHVCVCGGGCLFVCVVLGWEGVKKILCRCFCVGEAKGWKSVYRCLLVCKRGRGRLCM